MSYYINRIVAMPFDDALLRVKEELKKEGFGILTEIDVKATLKNKLDIDFRNYRILGACNPTFAHEALQIEERVGILLPCNVIVHETTQGEVEVASIDPSASMEVVGSPRLETIARQVRSKLEAMISRL
jgi:uncharacterized protein (DUF302 family)